MVYTSPEETSQILDAIGRQKQSGRRIIIGFQGLPPNRLLARAVALSDEVVDLDEPRPGAGKAEGEAFVPQVYCAIIKTILANVALRTDWSLLILASGIDKCDGGRFAAWLARDLVRCPVITAENMESVRLGSPISVSDIPLVEKVALITRSVVSPLNPEQQAQIERRACRATAGFWGVPPYDFNILKLFPDQTHVFGWTRCMENRTPADLELEMIVDPAVPTVFYAQSFCQKNSLAFQLAKQHNGLYVEVDGRITGSARAKIEAFLRLNTGYYRGAKP